MQAHPEFHLSERQVDERTREIAVEGELGLAVADQLEAALERATTPRILIDMAACDFIDSHAIATILRAGVSARERGERIVLHSPPEQMRRVLAVAGLTEIDLVFATREDALSALRSAP